ncbi:MAG: aminopeptidase P N-terminal domain-containing protein [Longimicrobiales bacterium]
MAHPIATHQLALEPRDLYRGRRERVLSALGEHSALVLAAYPERQLGRDTEIRYIVNPELYYLTGYREPEAVVVLRPGAEPPYTMFVRPRDPERERWAGARGGAEAARAVFGADEAHPIQELAERLPALLADTDVIYARLDSAHPQLVELLSHALARGRSTRARSGKGPHTLTDPGVLLDELRVIKDEYEIAQVRRAAELSVAGFFDALPWIEAGHGEWEIEAALDAGFRKRGADGCAFPTIVAAGANATVLHYVRNDCALQAGQLVLIDAGARYQMYCGDISRTFPVSGHFSARQRVVYDAVLHAHDAAIAAARPGATVDDLHRGALEPLLNVLFELDMIDGKNLDQARDDEASYRQFIPHKTSHWLGLDVHDVGAYALRTGGRPLQPGMVLTVEPGLYIPQHCERAPTELRGCGVRIEDDILITDSSCEVLTAALPVRAHDIEALMQKRRA